MASAAPLVASLAVAAGAVPGGAPVRIGVVLAAWALPVLLLCHLLLPGFDRPGRTMRTLPRARRAPPRLALTFDDGPHPETTPAILEALARMETRASFFLVGEQVRRHPELARRIAAEGHLVGNHTQRHRLLAFRTRGEVDEEIGACQETLRAAGLATRWFRPPHGFRPLGLDRLLRRRGLRMVAWRGTLRDTDAPGAGEIVARALRAARPGAILLLHDNPTTRGQTAEALPALVAALRARGYRLVRLDDGE